MSCTVRHILSVVVLQCGSNNLLLTTENDGDEEEPRGAPFMCFSEIVYSFFSFALFTCSTLSLSLSLLFLFCYVRSVWSRPPPPQHALIFDLCLWFSYHCHTRKHIHGSANMEYTAHSAVLKGSISDMYDICSVLCTLLVAIFICCKLYVLVVCSFELGGL